MGFSDKLIKKGISIYTIEDRKNKNIDHFIAKLILL